MDCFSSCVGLQIYCRCLWTLQVFSGTTFADSEIQCASSVAFCIVFALNSWQDTTQRSEQRGSKASFQAEVYVVGCFCGLQHWSKAVAKTLLICHSLFFCSSFHFWTLLGSGFVSIWFIRHPGPCCSSPLALWSPAPARWNLIPMDFWCRRCEVWD